VLCNAWSAATSVLWLIDLLPAPAPVEIRMRKLNTTTVTTEDIVEAYKQAISPAPETETEEQVTGEDGVPTQKKKNVWHRYDPDGYFHPFDGKLAKLGLLVPVAYFIWGISAIPSWGMMLIVSFMSRTMM
jgi:hypothetical protein